MDSTKRRRNSTRAKGRRIVKPPAPKPPTVADTLIKVRNGIEIAMSVAYVTGAALKDQGADVDREAALALQRCVGDELDRQIERIDGLISEVAS